VLPKSHVRQLLGEASANKEFRKAIKVIVERRKERKYDAKYTKKHKEKHLHRLGCVFALS
jgi:ribosomal protein S17